MLRMLSYKLHCKRKNKVTISWLFSPKNSKPTGFTLVELLVVITIIAIIASMAGMAMINAIRTAHQASVHDELNGMHQAIESKFGNKYPPNLQDNEKRVKSYIESKYPNADFDGQATKPPANLDPAQTLVFWLGGNNSLSQASDNPFSDNSRLARAKALFSFSEERFDQNKLGKGDHTVYYPAYPANQEKPYVYFHYRSYKKYYDSSEKSYGAKPYRSSRTDDQDSNSNKIIFVNKKSFQLMSAGLDSDYGDGGYFPSGKDMDERDKDNVVNFTTSTTIKGSLD